MKKSNIATAVICAVVLSATSFYSGYAASGSSGITYNSQGKIVFNNGTSSKTDDVVFDASDFTTIDNMVSSGKSNIVSELNKYSTTNISATNPTFSQLATAISNISAGTDATANHILSGKKALVGKNIVTGSMPSKQAATYTPGTSDQTINSGQYLSGNQTIKGDSNLTGTNIVSGKSIFGVAGSHICSTLQSQTSDATATKADILSGKTAYVNGNKVEGSIPSKQAATYTPGTSDQIINSGQYLSGNQTIKGDQNLAGANIVSGKSIFGVAGSHICSTLQSQTSDATATEADILLGKTAYVNGSKKTGNMADNGAVSKTLSVGESYTIPQGYHNGSGTISVPDDANLISENIKEGINIFGVPGSLNTNSEGTFKKDDIIWCACLDNAGASNAGSGARASYIINMDGISKITAKNYNTDLSSISGKVIRISNNTWTTLEAAYSEINMNTDSYIELGNLPDEGGTRSYNVGTTTGYKAIMISVQTKGDRINEGIVSWKGTLTLE